MLHPSEAEPCQTIRNDIHRPTDCTDPWSTYGIVSFSPGLQTTENYRESIHLDFVRQRVCSNTDLIIGYGNNQRLN